MMVPSSSLPVASSSLFSSYHYSYEPHWKLYPLQYEVSRVPSSTSSMIDNLDGDVTKDCWQNIPWSDDFGDIQGPDNANPITTIPRTRFKAMYDDEYLYIAGELHPAPNRTTEAHCTERNQVIYRTDSDFEVFIDIYGTNHDYKELEINANNIVWNLMLDKPYRDGGSEHSARVAPSRDSPDYYEVQHQHTATQIVHGKVNDYIHHQGAYWTVELALAYSDLLVISSKSDNDDDNHHPQSNKFWRVNFSRVEDGGNINWTWQSQTIVWDPLQRKYRGFIDMHMPESWGYFHFANNPTIANYDQQRDPTWPAKLAATALYAALHHYHDTTGQYTNDPSLLILPPEIMAPFHVTIELLASSNNHNHQGGFLATVSSRIDSTVVTIRDDRLLQVVRGSAMK